MSDDRIDPDKMKPLQPIGDLVGLMKRRAESAREIYMRRVREFRDRGGRCILCWDTGKRIGEVSSDKTVEFCNCDAGIPLHQEAARRKAALLLVTSGTQRFECDLTSHPNSKLVAALEEWQVRSWLSALGRADKPTTGGDDPFLLLYGATGVGKSQLAAALLRKAIRAGADSAAFVSMVKMIDDLRPQDTTDRTLFTNAQQSQAVVLDDMGLDKLSEWVESRVYQVIDERYTARKWTIITTNKDPLLTEGRESLIYWIGERCYGRIVERATIVNCGGPERNLRQ